MGAARHVGRVGTLAVALGLGTAVLSGYGIAAADTTTGPSSAASPPKPANAEITGQKKSSVAGSSSPNTAAAQSRSGSGADVAGTQASKRMTGKSIRTSPKPPSIRLVTPTATAAERETTAGSPNDTTVTAPAPKPASTTLAAVSDAAAETSQKVATAALHVVADAVTVLLDPFSGTTPATPTGSPAEWVVAAAARRELSTTPITAAPAMTLADAVITGGVNATDANGYQLTFSLAGKPDAGGKVTLNAKTGTFTFLPDESIVGTRGTETFMVKISETTALAASLQKLPVLGGLVHPVVLLLRQYPTVGAQFEPLIGTTIVVPVAVDIGEVVPEGTPIAFTTKVVSFDGTLISTNFFPALGLMQGQLAPTILDGPGLATAGDTNPTSAALGPFPGIASLRAAGYNVVTWDPRGEFSSGGVLQLDNPAYEGRDVSAIISWLAQRPEAQLDAADDPRMGMVGYSYGGGIQLVTAATDHRVDAIVPGIAWHSLNSSLYKDGAFRTGYGALLTLALVMSGSNINPEIYSGILSGGLLGYLTAGQQDLLAASGPGDELINNITAPTLLMQGTVDVLFTLQEAMTNAKLLDANGVPVKMVWFCGGHGSCLTPNDTQTPADAMMAWLDRWVKGDGTVDTGPKFEWIDQHGHYYSSEVLPTDAEFHGTSVVAVGPGGLLPIVPLLGGSGPSGHSAPPFSIADADKADIALNMTVHPGVATQIVGSPELTMTYSGLGTGTHIYAQLIDNNTGLVVGNLVTPVPVTLDGRVHTVTVPLEAIAQTMSETDSLTLQLVGSSAAYLNLTSFGAINVGLISLSLPTVAAGVAAREVDLESVA